MRPAKLADAQYALANEYGFPTWAKLKGHVEDLTLSPAEALREAVCDMDPERVGAVLKRYPELRAKIDDPLPNYGPGQHALFAAVQRGDRAVIEVLLGAGASINQRTVAGFGVLDECHPDMAAFLLERGALLDAHSAARLGMSLQEFVAEVQSRGAEGRTPLHFASTIEVAEFLLAHGADIDARDTKYESTPAQHMLRVEHKRHYPHDRQDVARYLVSRGCHTDIIMAAALGDGGLVERLLDADPECIRMTVSSPSVYVPLLGEHRTAHTVARDFGHEDVYELLMQRTPEDLKPKFVWDGNARRLPDAARSNDADSVRAMLAAGWPVDARGEMGASALHWAAFNGNAKMTREILKHHPTLELKSEEQSSTALGWAIFGSGNGWHSETGDFAGAVQALLDAGALLPPHAEELEPSDAVLQIMTQESS